MPLAQPPTSTVRTALTILLSIHGIGNRMLGFLAHLGMEFYCPFAILDNEKVKQKEDKLDRLRRQ